LLVYWLLFGYFAAGAFAESWRPAGARTIGPFFLVGVLLMTAVVGLRFHVGADWIAYDAIFRQAAHIPAARYLRAGDPGYQFINLLVHRSGGGIWLVNLLCAAVFTWGLTRFAAAQERPWLAMVVAIPYLVIVVAMGYTRQGASIGFVMAGMASYLKHGSLLRLAFYVVAAASFHRTAVAVLPLIALAKDRRVIINAILVAAATYLLYSLFLSAGIHRLVKIYIEHSYQSEGATVRVLMTALPAILFLIRSRYGGFTDRERVLWRNVSIAALGCTILLPLAGTSTAIDRMALYLLPLQPAILSRPQLFLAERPLGAATVIAYSAAIQFVWLSFANFASFWRPYEFYALFG
jgi:hypothetical protein